MKFELKPPVVTMTGLEARPPDEREESLVLAIEDSRGDGPDPGRHPIMRVLFTHS